MYFRFPTPRRREMSTLWAPVFNSGVLLITAVGKHPNPMESPLSVGEGSLSI